MTEKVKSIFAGIADFASVVIIPVFLWGWWSVQQSIALNRAQADISIRDSYVTKPDFQSSITQLTLADAKIWEKEGALSQTVNDSVGEINLKLQHIQDMVDTVKTTK